jgi:hypothetical protein
MATPDSKARCEMRVPAPWPQSSAWVRLTTTGDLELELFDFSDEASNSLGGDVAWIWTVSGADLPDLLRHLPVAASLSDEAFLTSLIGTHPHIHALRDWLRARQIPLREDFDSQA